MENDYDQLIQACQSGEIDDLEFLMLQPELGELFLKEMNEKGVPLSSENAKNWLSEYENNNLYQ
jgi:hypothetical protein